MPETARDLLDGPENVRSVPAGELLDVFSGDAFDHDALALAEKSAGIGVWSIDLTTGLVRATAQFFRIMGLQPTNERILIDVVRELRHPDDRERVLAGFRHALEDGTDAYEMEYRIVRPDGKLRWIFGRGRIVRDRDGKPARYSGIDLDITDRKAAEEALAAARVELERMNLVLEQRVRERTAELEAEAKRRAEAESRLHQAQKMEAVGQLTGGIAHDFNNILQVILGNLEIVKLTLQRNEFHAQSSETRGQLFGAIATTQRSARSAGQLVQRLLAFSRQQTLQPAAIDANRLVAEMTDMIERTLSETISVETILASELWPTFADRNQLETALLNLVVNARDAMPEGGRLIIETSNVELDSTGAEDIMPGRYVMLSVSDTGCGIAKEFLNKVFEPFFTTKDTGKGSGLGLSMVYGFVKQSGGHVRIYSEMASGSTVKVYLPRYAGADSDQRATAAGGSTTSDALARARPGETVLLVEDAEDVRRLAVIALESLGYRVLHATDGPSALRLLDSADAARIDLLFTDVVLPGGMDGSALADALCARRPGVPVLLTSGYTRNVVLRQTGVDGDVLLLDKPYTIETLASSIRQAIDSGASASTSPEPK
ncbi:MAG: ATP-binding protein [Pseudomonadota bacterium]|nr:ATP-binding protein [Pseudomonadota bacterium]